MTLRREPRARHNASSNDENNNNNERHRTSIALFDKAWMKGEPQEIGPVSTSRLAVHVTPPFSCGTLPVLQR